MPGRMEAFRLVAVVALVALVPVFGVVGGGAFGFPGSSVWALVAAPVVLVLLCAGAGDDPDPGDTGA